MSKGSGRRTEDSVKVRNNWDDIFKKKPEEKKEEKNDNKK